MAMTIKISSDDAMAVKVLTFAKKHHIPVLDAAAILALEQNAIIAKGNARIQVRLVAEIETISDSLINLKRALRRGDISIGVTHEREY